MSLSLFNAALVGAIEVLFDVNNQPLFKRADLGRYLDIKDIRHMFKDVSTKSRCDINGGGRGSEPLPKQGQNDHDVFVSLDSALEITVRSKKTRALALVKWLALKGIEKIQEEHQQAIEAERRKVQEKDTQIQLIQYENVGLQGEIRAKEQVIEDLIANRHE